MFGVVVVPGVVVAGSAVLNQGCLAATVQKLDQNNFQTRPPIHDVELPQRVSPRITPPSITATHSATSTLYVRTIQTNPTRLSIKAAPCNRQDAGSSGGYEYAEPLAPPDMASKCSFLVVGNLMQNMLTHIRHPER